MKRNSVAYIALGSNLGDRQRHLDDAVRALRSTPSVEVLRVSRWIETRAVGGPRGQPDFLNGAAAIESSLAARELLSALQAIERVHGRDREHEVRHGPRTLDLDLLLFGDMLLDEPGLTLPHPGLEERWFVLAPLAEIAPELVLPRSGKVVAERSRELAPLSVRAP